MITTTKREEGGGSFYWPSGHCQMGTATSRQKAQGELGSRCERDSAYAVAPLYICRASDGESIGQTPDGFSKLKHCIANLSM